MSRVVVNGASDDLVELDGDLREETECYSGEAAVRFSTGTILRVRMVDDEWKIDVQEPGDDTRIVIEAAPAEGKGCDYSDYATVTGPITWVEVIDADDLETSGCRVRGMGLDRCADRGVYRPGRGTSRPDRGPRGHRDDVAAMVRTGRARVHARPVDRSMMSTLAVTAEPLTIHEHPNADALELAQVGLYRAVVPKGVYRTGEYAIYIPEQSILPDDLIAELGLTGRLGGKHHNRVTAVRLRGEISQGIVCRPDKVSCFDLGVAHAEGTNFADELGITKWVVPIPVHMSGEMRQATDLIPWIEIENIKRYPAIFTPGEPVVATEKIHGTACLYTRTSDGADYVSSKGFGHKRLGIVESATNLYWRAVLGHGVRAFAADLLEAYGADKVGIFGEVYGKGVQDLAYATTGGADVPAYAVFDIAVEIGGGLRWLGSDELEWFITERLPTAPRLYAGPYDEAAMLALAEGIETVSGTGAHLREGVVIRPATERYSYVTGGRAIGKLVSTAYLTRKGGTEYE